MYDSTGVCVMNTAGEACDINGGTDNGKYSSTGVCVMNTAGEACDINGGTDNGKYSSTGVCVMNTAGEACDINGGTDNGKYSSTGVCVMNTAGEACDINGGTDNGKYSSTGVCVMNTAGEACDINGGTDNGMYSSTGVCVMNTAGEACDINGGTDNGMYSSTGVCVMNTAGEACDINGITDNGKYSSTGICVMNTPGESCDINGRTNNGKYNMEGVCIMNVPGGSCDAGDGVNTGRYNISGECVMNTVGGSCDAGSGANTGRYNSSGSCIEVYGDTTTIPAPNDIDNDNYERTVEYRLHYGLSAINAEDAYNRGYFGQGVTIAIVDSGVATHHPDLADRITLGSNFGGNPATTDSHGTFVALFAAGGIGNNAMDITITISGNEEFITSPFHGVAPSASIMPLRIGTDDSLTGSSNSAFQYAVRNNVQIINNSYGAAFRTVWKYEGRGDNFFTLELPYFQKVIDGGSGAFYRGLFTSFQRTVENADTVLVWSAGNDRWFYDPDNIADTGRFRLCRFDTQAEAISHRESECPNGDNIEAATQQNLYDNIRGVDDTDDPNDIFPDEDDEAGRNDPGGYALAPFYEETLFGKWLVVGATDNTNSLALISNGCGISKFWCLVAPGSRLRFQARRAISGTSFSAPIVSGALAVLKSRLPSMPMEVVRAILLTTATDLGARGVDDVYGWGLVNLSAAINFQGELLYSPSNLSVTTHAGFEVVAPGIGIGGGIPLAATSNDEVESLTNTQTLGRTIKLSETNIKLPANLAHVKNELAKVEIAISGVGDAYYNTALSDLVEVETNSANSLGDAAADMFLTSHDNHFGTDLLFAATDSKSGQFKYIGAEINNTDFGAWRFQHNFCDDCQRSVWQQWNVLNEANLSTPFFAQNKSNFILQMQGDGLRPFAAMGGEVHGIDNTPYQQFGLRWKQSHNKFGYTAEVSQIHERNSFWGANFGAIGHTKARTHQGRFALSGEISQNWQAHISYEKSFADVSVGEGSILSDISKLRAEGWALGVEGRDVFWGGDRLRLSARRNTGIHSGTAKLGYVRADGDFNCAFYKSVLGDEYNNLCSSAKAQQTVYTQSTINLADTKDEIYALGYAMHLSDNTQWAIGAEYETKRDLAAFSAQLQITF